MANELHYNFSTGLYIYAVLVNATGKFVNDTAVEDYNEDNWGDYAIELTETANGWYFADMPAIAAGLYTVYYFFKMAGPADKTDASAVNALLSWDGTAVTAPAGTSRYATVGELKNWIGITDATDDTVIASVLDEASRDIDAHCGRFFYQTAAATVYYFTAVDSWRLLLPDCVSLAAVATDTTGDRTYGTTWAATDYDLTPDNAAALAEPYTTLEVAPQGSYRLPVGVRKGVKLTGVWGWPAVPDAVKTACLLRASWLFQRRVTPLGLAGSADIGMVRVGRWDPDFEKMLETYRRVNVT